MATKKNETAMAVIENFDLPVLSEDMGQAMAEELDGLLPAGGWPLRFRATTRRTRTQRRRSSV